MENQESIKEDNSLTKQFDAGKVKTILKGTAPEQFNPKAVNIAGTITAVSRFIEKRKSEFYDKKAHCLVSKSDGKMKLIVNEQSVCDKYTVEASVYEGKRFVDLGINNADKGYTPIQLSKKFRLLRSIFPSRAEHTAIVTLLRNIKVKINQDIDKSDDARGGVKLNFAQALESNIPESFKIVLPLLEGEEPTTIEVQVIIEVESGQNLMCYLESIDGADMIEELKDKLVTEEVAKIEDDCTVIFY